MPLFLANFFASGGKPPFFRNAFLDFQVGQSSQIIYLKLALIHRELRIAQQIQEHSILQIFFYLTEF